jgi:hypothetical protein
MRFPTPDDPANAPVWENYVVAQTAQAALGLIPRSALAMGVEVDRANAVLRFQLAACTPEDVEDMDDIVSELEVLLGQGVKVTRTADVVAHWMVEDPSAGMRWVYLAHE